jgi:Xaa-Pro aminopeptidase
MIAEWQAELEHRRSRVGELAAAMGCDQVLVFGADRHGQSFRYLTSFEPVLGDMWLHMAGEPQCVLTFGWQIEEGRRLSGIERWEAAPNPLPLVVAALREAGSARVAVAGLERMPLPAYNGLHDGVPGLELVDIGARIDELRRIKSPLEVERMREACRVTDAMLDAARAELQPGITEAELAARVSTVALAAGGELAFEPAVISGNDDPIPIRRATNKRIEPGDTVMVDLGASLGGYQGDASRSFVLGEPNRRQRQVWDVVLRAYRAALRLARPGVPCRELHRVSAAILEDAGFAVAHRVGHGVGLATSYEWPSLDTEEAPLEPGMTICIEPGVYTPGAGNMKLEDDVLITDDGCELLTRSDRTLEVAL